MQTSFGNFLNILENKCHQVYSWFFVVCHHFLQEADFHLSEINVFSFYYALVEIIMDVTWVLSTKTF